MWYSNDRMVAGLGLLPGTAPNAPWYSTKWCTSHPVLRILSAPLYSFGEVDHPKQCYILPLWFDVCNVGHWRILLCLSECGAVVMVAHGSGKYQVQVSVKHGAIQSHMVQIVVQYDAHQVTRSGTLWLAWPGPVLPGLVSVIAVLRVRGEGWPPCYCATSLPHPPQPSSSTSPL